MPAGAIDHERDLMELAAVFDDGHLADWNNVDWFAVKVLNRMVQQSGEPCARAISDWSTAANLWRRRASGVAFVSVAKLGDRNFDGFTDMLLQVCDRTVRHRERFAQTGTGWVLRELAKAEPERVLAFVEAHLEHFSREGLRYALEKMPEDERRRLERQRRRRIVAE